MKIIFCLNHFLPERLAGIEIYTLNLAQSLQAKGVNVLVLIPNFDSQVNDCYLFENIRVIRYAEPGEENRAIIMGRVAPSGLGEFIKIVEKEQPDILHFQELAAGRGIGNFHVQAAADLDIKILTTFHLSTYSCFTGNLMFKEHTICDGIIRQKRCTACAYHGKRITGVQASILELLSNFLYKSGADSRSWNSKLGTALAFPFVIDKLKKDLLQLADRCERIIVYTHWYQKILEINGVSSERISYCKQGIPPKVLPLGERQCAIPLRVIFVGRISQFKGVHLLIEAVKSLPTADIKVDIFGPVTEDSYGAYCKELSAPLDNVNWKGMIAPGKVVETIAGYDLLCLPSTFSEMGPLVIQEAYAAGIPVLASNVYGNAEQVIDGKSGWLFEYKSVLSLKEKLQMLIKEPALVDAAKSQIPATRSYSEMAEDHITIYQEVLNKNKL